MKNNYNAKKNNLVEKKHAIYQKFKYLSKKKP